MRTRLLKKAPRLGAWLTEEVFAALAAQTVVVTGTNAAGIVLPRLAAQLAALRQQRAEVAEQVEELVAAHPLSKVLTTMPGVGVRTCARILTEVVGKDFPTAGHLASYAGLAPVTRRSGTSIRGEHPPRGGNKVLKRALFLSAFAALSDPVSRAYYDRKRAQQKKHKRPSSPSPAAAPTSCTPCSETTSPTPTRHLLLLDKGHRGTPRAVGLMRVVALARVRLGRLQQEVGERDRPDLGRASARRRRPARRPPGTITPRRRPRTLTAADGHH